MVDQDFEDIDPRFAWAVGVFEGEGCIAYNKAADRWSLIMEMTDLDVMESFYAIIGERGYLNGPYENDGNLPRWRWQAASEEHVVSLLEEMLPFLHERRSTKAVEAIDAYNTRRKWKTISWERDGMCSKGHDITIEANVRIDKHGYRRCKVCQSQAQRRHYLKKKEKEAARG